MLPVHNHVIKVNTMHHKNRFERRLTDQITEEQVIAGWSWSPWLVVCDVAKPLTNECYVMVTAFKADAKWAILTHHR